MVLCLYNGYEVKTMNPINEYRDYYVVKGNELIQRAIYSMTTQQQKLLLYLISKIKPYDDKETLYSISIREYCDIAGIEKTSGSNYISIKNSLDKIDAVKTWIIRDDGKLERIRWFNRLIINADSGTIQASFHETIWNYIFDLQKRYTQYQLVNVLPLRSKWSIRIYELCASYKYQGYFEMPLDEFRKVIGVNADKKNDDGYTIDVIYKKNKTEIIYRKISHLRAILDRACVEINDFTNISIQYNLYKEGRSFNRIGFTIKNKRPLDETMTHARQRERLNK